MVDADAHFRSMRKRRRRLDKAAKNAQIARDRQNLPFRFNINDFGFGRERAPHRAMLFHPHNQSMNLFDGRPPRQIRAGVSFFTWMPRPGFPRLFRSFRRFNADWSRTLAAPILLRRKPKPQKEKGGTMQENALKECWTKRNKPTRTSPRWPKASTSKRRWREPPANPRVSRPGLCARWETAQVRSPRRACRGRRGARARFGNAG